MIKVTLENVTFKQVVAVKNLDNGTQLTEALLESSFFNRKTNQNVVKNVLAVGFGGEAQTLSTLQPGTIVHAEGTAYARQSKNGNWFNTISLRTIHPMIGHVDTVPQWQQQAAPAQHQQQVQQPAPVPPPNGAYGAPPVVPNQQPVQQPLDDIPF